MERTDSDHRSAGGRPASHELPDEVLQLIFLHCSPDTLRTALPLVCRRFRRIATDAAEDLWLHHLERDYPLFVPGRTSARSAYAQARSGAAIEVQWLNCFLRAGTFGSGMYAKGSYVGKDKGMKVQRGPEESVVCVPHGVVRAPCSGSEFQPLPSFRGLKNGMLVELQWKLSAASKRYAWWCALVHRVISDDQIELAFPQYGTVREGGSGALTGLSVINRSQETLMHGGIAGGIRVPTKEEVVQWWYVCGTSELDLYLTPVTQRPGWVFNPDLKTIRSTFLSCLPSDQPRRSLQLADVDKDSIQGVENAVKKSRAHHEPSVENAA